MPSGPRWMTYPGRSCGCPPQWRGRGPALHSSHAPLAGAGSGPLRLGLDGHLWPPLLQRHLLGVSPHLARGSDDLGRRPGSDDGLGTLGHELPLRLGDHNTRLLLLLLSFLLVQKILDQKRLLLRKIVFLKDMSPKKRKKITEHA